MIEIIRSLYGYHIWANEKMLTAAAQLSTEQWIAPDQSNHGSLRDVMAHIVSVERGWLNRVGGRPREPPFDPQSFESVPALRDCWYEVNAFTQALINNLDDAALVKPIEWVNLQGLSRNYPMWQMLVHQFNHAGQHRSEAVYVMTTLGVSSGWLDYMLFADEVEKLWTSNSSG